MPARVVIRGVTPQGDAAETFTIENGRARWTSQVDRGEAPYSSARFYAPFGGPIDMTAWLIERLVAAPNRTLDLLPGGQARAEQLTIFEVGDGANRQTITAWAVSGLANAPTPIWTDAKGVKASWTDSRSPKASWTDSRRPTASWTDRASHRH